MAKTLAAWCSMCVHARRFIALEPKTKWKMNIAQVNKRHKKSKKKKRTALEPLAQHAYIYIYIFDVENSWAS